MTGVLIKRGNQNIKADMQEGEGHVKMRQGLALLEHSRSWERGLEHIVPNGPQKDQPYTLVGLLTTQLRLLTPRTVNE